MLTTRLCKFLGIEVPIISAPMGPDLTGPDLVAAVSGAGGLGLLQAQLNKSVDFREQIRRVRKATNKPFGVNFILALPHEEDLEVSLEEHVPVVSFFWGPRDTSNGCTARAARSSSRSDRWTRRSVPPQPAWIS